jgi:hypothetical protein
MSKKLKIWIIIAIIMVGILVTCFITMIIIAGIYNILYGTIDKRIKKYEHNNKVIYSDYENIYYMNEVYRYENDILWIDENNVIYINVSKYYITNNDGTKELSLDVEYVSHGSLFLKDDIIYFKQNNDYYAYNNQTDTKSSINKDIYYDYRDGNNYKIDTTIEYNKISISIIHNDIKKEITKKKILKTKFIDDVIENDEEVRVFNYSVWDDQIILHLYAGPYCILMKYDFEKDIIEYYDWFYRDTSRTCYLAFKINNVDNCQILKTLIEQ